MKTQFFKINKVNLLDKHIFNDFICDFIGPNINPDHEILMKYERRRGKNKPSMYIYDPVKNKKEEKQKNFFFPNISGNEIKNVKYQKLSNEHVDTESDNEEYNINNDSDSDVNIEDNNIKDNNKDNNIEDNIIEDN